ncbi:MAG TPA: flagellar biosynthesis protein FliQ [Candidatus Latescibacteria bacterium]|nr:flagellar biosynthetic protein FliQ [Gemmatimonadota bacterium]MDP7364939.1 flagellar biosynthesis protein FliQ [Candidatus Latescibacterota bacterium]MDP7635616.1 flagellar biosynthesis protein FliQ [Candidatus Latescibacterota bacterium]HCV25595.1 flagellar biosynthetic protein FliQ [Candidatus Latescibacterota bacterium]HJN29581.1 flagellar biosynthesis protein FliQ [Candidatus Latescibacterota bacterium]
MSPDFIIKLGQEVLTLTLYVGGPVLIVALVVGLGVSIFQAVTQVHEMTLTFIPKIVAVGATIILVLPWMMQRMIDFTVNLLSAIPTLIG